MDGLNNTRMQRPWMYALMLKLRPRTAGSVWPNAGQLAHGALLAWFAAVDAALASRLHEPNQDRPFTCSSLWFPNEREVARAQRENRKLPVFPGQVYWLRLTLLQDDLFGALTARFSQPAAPVKPVTGGSGGADLPTIRLGDVEFDVLELVATTPDEPTSDAHASSLGSAPGAWAGYTTYAALVERARALDPSGQGAGAVGLEFRSPTAFSDGQCAWGKRMHLFPDADRVYDRLARVWNRWAPAMFRLDPRAIEDYAREWMAVSHYALETRTLRFDRHAQVGFTGRCVYTLMDGKRPVTPQSASPAPQPGVVCGDVGAGLTPAQAAHLLTAFALYAGVGQKTAMGMGQVRPLFALPLAGPQPAAPARHSDECGASSDAAAPSSARR